MHVPVGFLSQQSLDRTTIICAAIYLAMTFTRWNEVSILAAWIGMFALLLGAPRHLFSGLWCNVVVIKAWLAFLVWALAVSVLSTAPDESFKQWWNDFDDHFLAAPLLAYLLIRGKHAVLLAMLAWAGAFIILLNALAYLGDLANGNFWHPDNWLSHRKWGHPLVFFSPFLLIFYQSSRGIARIAWAAANLLMFLMVLGTGYRSVWLAYLVSTGVIAFFLSRSGHKLVHKLAIPVILLAFACFAVSPQGGILQKRIDQGFDSSLRVSGTWKPAWDMSLQAPWFGHGLGSTIYANEYTRNAPAHAEWAFSTKPINPHNMFLATAFALGFPGALLLVLLLGTIVAACLKKIGKAQFPQTETQLALATLSSLIGYFIVRGSFANVSWHRLSIPIGIAVGLSLVGFFRKDNLDPHAHPPH